MDCWYSSSRLDEAVRTSTHNPCFGAKIKKMYTPVNPTFSYINGGFQGVHYTELVMWCLLERHLLLKSFAFLVDRGLLWKKNLLQGKQILSVGVDCIFFEEARVTEKQTWTTKNVFLAEMTSRRGFIHICPFPQTIYERGLFCMKQSLDFNQGCDIKWKENERNGSEPNEKVGEPTQGEKERGRNDPELLSFFSFLTLFLYIFFIYSVWVDHYSK